MTQKYTQDFDSLKGDFIKSVVGVQYERGIYGTDTMNCYALAVRYFEFVHGMKLDTLNEKSAATRKKLWRSVESELSNFEVINKPEVESIVLTAYNDGNPTHVGVIIAPGKVLHAAGVSGIGCVQITSMRNFELYYGKSTYHRVKFQ